TGQPIRAEIEHAAPKSEAKKLIRGNGAKINDEKVVDENLLITTSHLINNEYIKLSAGKKRHILVRIEGI
ncbi:MAG: hypothetical protein V4485_01865, partial [Pseudomonadota bacterium]